MTVKEEILRLIWNKEAKGLTAFEGVAETGKLAQTVYPCFTLLCREGFILDSLHRRKSPRGRNSIVWVAVKYGGVVPVWQNRSPTYACRGRARQVMDVLGIGSHTARGIRYKLGIESMSLSSLLSHLQKQKWVQADPIKRKERGRKSCLIFRLTPLGRRILKENSPAEGYASTPGYYN